MGDGYMCGRNVKMKESLSHFCGISFLPKWDFFFCGLQIWSTTKKTIHGTLFLANRASNL